MIMETHFKVNPHALLKSLKEISSMGSGDVTLVCRDGCVSSHSLLLGAVSPLLRQAMLSCPKDMEDFTIITTWCSVEQMQRVLSTLTASELEDDSDMFVILEFLGMVFDEWDDKRERSNFKVEDIGHDGQDYGHGEDDLYHSSFIDDDIPKVKIEVSSEYLTDISAADPLVVEDPDPETEDQIKSLIALNSPGQYKCHYEGCDFQAKNQSLARVKDHMTKHFKYKPWRCQFESCDKKFAIRQQALNHAAVHSQIIKLVKCDHCDKSFNNTVGLKAHINFSHKESPSQYQCSICTFCTNQKAVYERHCDAHLDENENDCIKTKRTPAMIKASQAANLIIMEVDLDGKKVYKCTKCAYTNELRYKTVRHCYKHTKILPFQCELCDEMFRDVRACQEHVTRDHNGVKQYSCDQCATMFTCKTSLQSHLKRHSIPSDLFKCEIDSCEFSTNLKGTLQKHVERRHTSENKTHLCNSCGKTFFDKVDLARHEESIHVVPHLPCRFCPKLYPTERHRTAHESRVHSTELRFQCDECPMGYRHPSSLQKHILSAHRGDEAKKFKCSQCGKGFITNGKLMAHERIHTGEKRYACPYCGLRFTDSSAMSRHKKIHEGGNKHTCDICGKTYSQSYDVVKHKTAVHGVVPTKQWEHHYKGETNSSMKKREIISEKDSKLLSKSSSEAVGLDRPQADKAVE